MEKMGEGVDEIGCYSRLLRIVIGGFLPYSSYKEVRETVLNGCLAVT